MPSLCFIRTLSPTLQIVNAQGLTQERAPHLIIDIFFKINFEYYSIKLFTLQLMNIWKLIAKFNHLNHHVTLVENPPIVPGLFGPLVPVPQPGLANRD